ncbi:cysteine peptidase family C39 domain-containing protein [Pedobacter sp.]|uniref:cysteine peptidase family C39 domain-containing protein n=1 Tax=Pedobacter sp. TaxID=1411316 RepID=UPI00396C8E51
MLLRPKENALAVTQLLLKNIDAKISYDSLKKALYDHPEYPSLLAISDVLNEYHIHNEAYQIKKEEYKAEDMLFPFIAHVNSKGGVFMLVHHINDGKVTFSNEKSKKSIIPEKDFIQQWSGIALYARVTPNSGETRYYEKQFLANLKTLGKPLFILTLLSTLFLGLNLQILVPGYYILLLVKLLGVGICVLLLAHSIDANNPFVRNLCGLGSKNNCNAILKSDAAKINEWLSWSEVGFFYFMGSFLALYFNPSLMPYRFSTLEESYSKQKLLHAK